MIANLIRRLLGGPVDPPPPAALAVIRTGRVLSQGCDR